MKLNHLAYPAKFKKEVDYTLISFRDLPFAFTSADKDTRPMWQAMDCLDEAVAGLIADGELVPDPTRAREGETMVPVPAITATKAILIDAMRDQKVTVSRLAKNLGKDPKDIRRIIDPRHPTKMGTMVEALAEVGIVSTLSFSKAVAPEKAIAGKAASRQPAIKGVNRGRVAEGVRVAAQKKAAPKKAAQRNAASGRFVIKDVKGGRTAERGRVAAKKKATTKKK